MKSNSFNLWLILSISSAIRALFYHLSREEAAASVKGKTHTASRKTRDKLKSLMASAREVEDTNKSVIYTLSENARR